MPSRLSCFMHNVSEAGKSVIGLNVLKNDSSLAAAAHHEGRPDHALHARLRLLVHASKQARRWKKDAANSAIASRLVSEHQNSAVASKPV